MKLDPKFNFSPDLAQEIAADPAVSYVSAHYEGLWHAARLLGGYETARLVDRCAEILAQDRCLTPRTRIMLGQILVVLSMGRTDDANLRCMGYFAVIDPHDLAVEEIFRLAEGLRRALMQANAGGMARRQQDSRSQDA